MIYSQTEFFENEDKIIKQIDILTNSINIFEEFQNEEYSIMEKLKELKRNKEIQYSVNKYGDIFLSFRKLVLFSKNLPKMNIYGVTIREKGKIILKEDINKNIIYHYIFRWYLLYTSNII